jgi:tetratricopeptide (TPR) repeat protein
LWHSGLLICALVALFATSEPSRAQEPTEQEQQRLYQQMVRHPTNYAITYEYVKVATARGNYEAAIGALERLLYYNPNLGKVKYELGALYYRMGVYDMAKRYFREALETRDLDDATRAQIEASLANADKQTQPSRLSVFAQTGLRYQTNASYLPSSGVVQFSGQDFGLGPTQGAKSDWNWFGLLGVGHDYDLPGTGAVLETRFVGYDTEQFQLHDLDVGLFEVSVGPRMALAPNVLPGITVKPYVVGGDTWVGGAPYFASEGAGVSVGIPATAKLSFEPYFEWREVEVNDTLQFPEYGTGSWSTLGTTSSYIVSDQVKIDARAYYRRGVAAADYQDFSEAGAEIALLYQFAPPVPSIPRAWSVAPFGRFIRTAFDAPDPSINPSIARIDNDWAAGVILGMPITANFGISSTVEYDLTDSTLPNYTLRNFSILSGPTVRF